MRQWLSDFLRRDHSRGMRRPARRRQALQCLCEPLEGRTLLSLTLSILKDIDTEDSFPAQITSAGGNLFYTTHDASDNGTDLNVTTASGTSILKDFNTIGPDSYGVYLNGLTAAEGKLFFVADGGDGAGLWSSDGTVSGTQEVADLDPGANGYYPRQLTAAGGKLFFSASSGSQSSGLPSLYVSDGTAAGTIPVPVAGTNSSAYYLSDFTAFDGKLFFTDGKNLESTDGTAAGTTVVQTLPSTFVADLTVVGSKLFFAADDSNMNPALWQSDGTTSGTTVVRSFTPSMDSSSDSYPVANLTAVGSKLLFVNNDPTSGPALWVSDGTAAGTALVKSLPAATNSFQPEIQNATVAGTKEFFTVPDSANAGALELWVSDGTTGGTTELMDIHLAIGGNQTVSDSLGQFAAVNGNLLFANDDGTTGVELWESDGTASGTALLKDINPGPDGSFPENMTLLGDVVDFAAHDGTGGNQLWQSDGTAAGTVKLETFTPEATQGGLPAGFGGAPSFAVIGGTMYFTADNGINDTSLWKTDGTSAGTVPVDALGLGFQGASNLTAFDGELFFTTDDSASQSVDLWMSDGTSAGTTVLKSFPDTTYIQNLTPVGSSLFFTSGAGYSQTDLWVSDGTADGTTLLKDFSGSASLQYVSDPVVFDGKLFFAANDGGEGNELWTSDGTVGGTTLFDDINPGSASANPSNLTVSGGNLFFTASDGAPGTEIWISDGTTQGTRLLDNLGTAVTSVSDLTSVGSGLIFLASGASSTSSALWRTDGTTAGTLQIASFSNDDVSSFAAVSLGNGKAIFGLGVPTGSGTDDSQTWVSDGTAAGTMLLKDIAFNPGYDTPLVVGGLFYFAGTDPTHGTELWQTDGTPSGTTLDQDINSGPGSSDPAPLTMLNGNLLVAADDGVHGQELLSSSATVTNHSPTLSPIAEQPVSQGGTVDVTAMATDPDAGQILTFSLDPGAPSGASIDPSSGAFTWIVPAAQTPGNYPVTVDVTDNGSPPLSDSTMFTIVVSSATGTVTPVFSALSVPTITYGSSPTLIAGKLTTGTVVPSGAVAITLAGVTEQAAINATTGSFSLSFVTTTLHASASPYTVTFAYPGSAGLTATSATANMTVQPATPTISWAKPADITTGTALGSAQLDATASVPGTFTYTPASGAVLAAGSGQPLSVTFTPTDTTDYTTVHGSTTINVLTSTPTSTSTSTSTPPPTPPVITGAVGMNQARKGLTSITLTFNESMSASAGVAGNYSLTTPAKKQSRKHPKPPTHVAFTLQFNPASNTVVLSLPRPLKTPATLTVTGSAVIAASGATLGSNYQHVF